MILHLDMDAFFASVEQMDNPELRGKPVIIGGGDRGVVATASYEARVYGIHSAMPMATARKLCPNGLFIPGNYNRYSELSRMVMSALREFSPIVQQASIDEAYLDIKGLEKLFGELETLAMAVKKRVAAATGGLTCSIGIAPVKFLAKICSDQNKPDGVFILRPHEVDAFLLNLNIEKLPGVGLAMSSSLRSFGIGTVAQLRSLSREFMWQRYGKWGIALHERAYGLDPRIVHPNPPAKSESVERTFSMDIFDKKILARALWQHAEKLASRLRKHMESGRSITLKIKFADFRQITRTRTLAMKTDAMKSIYDVGLQLLDEIELKQPVRLIGIGVSGFEARPEQLILPGLNLATILSPQNRGDFSPARLTGEADRRKALDRSLDNMGNRFDMDASRMEYPDYQ